MMRVRLISVAGLQLLGGLIDVLLVLGERQVIKLDMDAVATTTIYGLGIGLLLCDQIVLPYIFPSPS